MAYRFEYWSATPNRTILELKLCKRCEERCCNYSQSQYWIETSFKRRHFVFFRCSKAPYEWNWTTNDSQGVCPPNRTVLEVNYIAVNFAGRLSSIAHMDCNTKSRGSCCHRQPPNRTILELKLMWLFCSSLSDRINRTLLELETTNGSRMIRDEAPLHLWIETRGSIVRCATCAPNAPMALKQSDDYGGNKVTPNAHTGIETRNGFRP